MVSNENVKVTNNWLYVNLVINFMDLNKEKADLL